ncbi:MAG: extensin family protein [Xanthomonadales bacterium]|nr:extensin family protein [Xanthomonadales bacterium]
MPNPVPASRRRALLLLLLFAALVVWALSSGRLIVAPRWNPWAALDLTESPGLLTGFKLKRASADPEACRRALAGSGFRLSAVPDRETGPGCGFQNAFRIDRSTVDVGAPFTLSCPAALSLALWERHALQQAARLHLGAEVRAIEQLGSYACRNLYGAEGRRRSQHATADALDISGFVLSDGRRIRVLRDWRRTGAVGGSEDALPTPEARFLLALRDQACRWFDAVLGPDYNAGHADHFHFDRGRARICR